MDMNSDMKSSVIVVNFSEEVFNDALFFLEQALETDNRFIKWRYYRAAIIYFCAATESYLHRIIQNKLKKKENRTDDEQQWLDFLEDENSSKWPVGATKINVKFNDALNFVSIEDVKENTEYQECFEDYKKLANVRNAIAHYATRNFNIVYLSDEVEAQATSAPDVVKKILIKICQLTDSEIPTWLNQNDSREIK